MKHKIRKISWWGKLPGKRDKMINLKDFKLCTKEQYEEANCVTNKNTAYIRIGDKRIYYMRRKIIPEFKLTTKTITLSGRDCDISNTISHIKKNCYKVKIK